MAGVGTNIFASTGLSASADTGSASLADQTYGPPAAGSGGAFSPRHGHGAGFWLAVAGVGILIFIRQSLPR